jgi:hypothetical protein
VGPKSVALEAVENYPTFRLLVTALMGLGMAGLGLMLLAGREIRGIVNVLTAGPSGSHRGQ